jgi:hypothetical protein
VATVTIYAIHRRAIIGEVVALPGGAAIHGAENHADVAHHVARVERREVHIAQAARHARDEISPVLAAVPSFHQATNSGSSVAVVGIKKMHVRERKQAGGRWVVQDWAEAAVVANATLSRSKKRRIAERVIGVLLLTAATFTPLPGA